MSASPRPVARPRRARPRQGARGAAPGPPILELGDNTSRFGAPPAALRVLAGARTPDAAAYPSPAADALREALAAVHGVAPEAIVAGCGSDDVIESAIRSFAGAGGRLAFAAPTFSMVPEFARRQGLDPVPVPFGSDGAWDATAIRAARPRVLYLCAPNNPTGHVPGGDLEPLLDCGADLVILDQAYAEFAGSLRATAPADPRLLVTRTLSKAWGLAGLRIGYGVATETLAARVARVCGPYRIGRLAERAAVAALEEERDWVERHVAGARTARAALAAALAAAGFRPLESEANFVLVPLPRAAAIARGMLARGVRVRAFAGLDGIGDALRITVGPPSEMDAALRALTATAGGTRSRTPA